MKYLMFMAAALLSSATVLSGQQHSGTCGNSTADQQEWEPRLLRNIATVESGAQVSDRDAIQYVPVHFHLVGDAGGNGRHIERKVLDQLCDLNTAYAPMDIRFYLSPHPTYGLFDRSISNNNVYNNQSNSFLMSTRRHNNAINVYVVMEPVPGTSQPGTILAYYSQNFDWVVSRKTETQGGFNGTMPHEFGHLFSLPHTFKGWEEESFGPNYPGWPIAPVISPGGVPTERQNGTNCSTAADLICDTPPDYNFGFEQGNCQPYTGGAKDPLGTLVDPMENNFMSYFSGCGSSYAFTPQQQAIILADLASPERNYLDNNYTPVTTEISTQTDLLTSPATGVVTTYYDEVPLQWNSVAGATYYLVEVDQTSSFNSPLAKNYVTQQTSILVTTLGANKNYYWRIRPFNEYVTCAEARQSSFKTSTVSGTNDLQDISAWQISPNPVGAGQSVRLSLQATDSFEGQVRIVNVAGEQVYSHPAFDVPAGPSFVDLPVEGLSNGLYFVVLENETGRDLRKLSVLR